MYKQFNFKWCREVSVIPEVKPIPKPPKPAKPKHVIIPWGKVPLVLKGEEQQTIEQEMMKLHYTYRKMEASQHHFHEESELVFRRQKSMLETLQFDNKLTQNKIDVFYPEDFAIEMKRLNAECAMWSEKIELEVMRVKELGERTCTLYDNGINFIKTMGGINSFRENNQANQIHVHIIEKRIFKAMQDLTMIQWHNKLMQNEMRGLQIEHELFEELHGKMEIELQNCMDEMDDTINKAYELYDERHDYHKLISEILELMEEDDAYTQWQNYGTWIGIDGRPLAESALQDEKERTERLKNKRPTLPLTKEVDLKRMFVLEGTEERLKFRSKPHTKKYERLIEVKAFMNIQQMLGLKTEQVEEGLPALTAARERHAQLVKDVQILDQEIEEALRFKLGRFATGTGDWNLVDTNDFLDIIRELKHQIFLVFKEAGCLDCGEDLEHKRKEGKTEEATSEEATSEEAPSKEATSDEAKLEEATSEVAPLEEAPSEEAPSEEAPSEEAPSEEAMLEEAMLEEAISKLFVKAEEFIAQMSEPEASKTNVAAS